MPPERRVHAHGPAPADGKRSRLRRRAVLCRATSDQELSVGIRGELLPGLVRAHGAGSFGTDAALSGPVLPLSRGGGSGAFRWDRSWQAFGLVEIADLLQGVVEVGDLDVDHAFFALQVAVAVNVGGQ